MRLFSKSHAPADQVRKFWGDAASGRVKGAYPVHWLESPLIRRLCVNPRISGDPDLDWLEWVKNKFAPEGVQSGFVLGCGGGALERRAAALGLCRSFLGVDISPDAIRVAQALAERADLPDFRYQAADANTLVLEPSSLDLVLSDMSLHHLSDLEHVLAQFQQALRAGGLLVLNEFAGPDRFQWTDAQLELATRMIRSLPLRLRRNRDLRAWKGLLKPWIWRAKRWTPERVARHDPSEAVRSAQIPQLVSNCFEIVHRSDYGGAALALALNNIVGNFSDTPEDIAILKKLVAEEDRWMQQGKLASDYVLIVCRNR